MNNNANVRTKNIQQIDSICSWYGSWTENERRRFLEGLAKLIRPSLDDIMNSLGGIKMTNEWSAPDVFTCQMKLLRDWWNLWDQNERQVFEEHLNELLTDEDKLYFRNCIETN
ncbi:Oidioi.mRNA.OKI2018_I69.chr1.g2043.t1.cds [Oikopleura dioica]|uniref:Oidioi.mRNA.OKI2018_I69.chr1.g2043.t1.cds n=1 Tax=Oikopleura dioica TaxID=34765 RepID=A0ABN7SPV7_OIKDI|nr:Oidioi.mRNA.OKI2018_I69.chr1.g2043.t1.cds [Oikopleura dioica]